MGQHHFFDRRTCRPSLVRGVDDLGYRYTTVQVFKTDSERHGLLMRGAEEAMAPVRLQDTGRIKFRKDSDNNWVELSQRTSLTGDLEPG